LVAATDASADDERFMRAAFDEAQQGDSPFGAVIVRDRQILIRAHNLRRTNDDPTAHGEMTAIRRALVEHGSMALQGSTLYTTGEPCAMCMGAILWCRFGRLVFAASVQQLATTRDQIMISSADIAAKAPFVPITITGGVLVEEAMRLLLRDQRNVGGFPQWRITTPTSEASSACCATWRSGGFQRFHNCPMRMVGADP
jgi:tRNA(Arg) A34 adenosine deaminase TadA